MKKTVITILVLIVIGLGVCCVRGYLDYQKAKHYELTDEEFEALVDKRFDESDVNKDGVISRQEFLEFNEQHLKKYNYDERAQTKIKQRHYTWTHADTNKDNMLTREEFKSQMFRYRDTHRPKEAVNQ